MTRLTDPPSPEAFPVKQTGEPKTAEEITYGSALAAMNPFLDLWLHSIDSDGGLPSEALGVASVMARSVGIGCVAFTDWQRINAALGRNRRDRAVFEIMSELELEGYINRNIDSRFGRNYGWQLLIPEGGQ